MRVSWKCLDLDLGLGVAVWGLVSDDTVLLTSLLLSWLTTSVARCEKMVLFHIAAIGWISPQTGYKIQGSYTKLNHIVTTKIRNLKATVTSKMTLCVLFGSRWRSKNWNKLTTGHVTRRREATPPRTRNDLPVNFMMNSLRVAGMIGLAYWWECMPLPTITLAL